MYPRQIIERAQAAGLDMIAVTDHNAAGNVAAAVRLARGKNMTVIPGMEITTIEEAHILGLFEKIDDAVRVETVVAKSLPKAPANYKLGNDQVIVNELDEVLGFSPYLLLGATRLSVYEVVDLIHSVKGLAIASHIDREAFSIPSQLGFIPQDLQLEAVEISPNTTRSVAKKTFAQYQHLPMVSFSDAHQPDEIGRRSTDFWLAGPTLAEIGKSLAGVGKRRIIES
jgi:predicted metal-dependent phosphoesterase TrpH